MNPWLIFDCCDTCDALLADHEKVERYGQTLCDPCAEEVAEANPDL